MASAVGGQGGSNFQFKIVHIPVNWIPAIPLCPQRVCRNDGPGHLLLPLKKP